MKILYLHQYFKTPDMAGGTRSYEMAKRLVEWGHEVHMVTAWTDGDRQKGWVNENIDGIHVHWLPVDYSNKMGFGARLKAFFSFAFHSAIKASTIKADVVFATSTPLTIALPGIFASKILKVPMVFEVRDLWPKVPIELGVLKNPLSVFLAKALEKFAYRNSNQIVALSQGMADGVIATGYPEKCVTLVPNSADLELFDPSKIKNNVFRYAYGLPKGPLVLYPGTLGKANGVKYLVHVAAAAYKMNPDIVFLVVGDGAKYLSVEQEAINWGVYKKNFFMLPALPKKKLVYAFSDSDLIFSLFIDSPALEANSANKFFDALAAGKPVAINYGGWQKELIENYSVGLTLSREPEAAAKSIIEFIDDKNRLHSSGINARKLAEEMFSRDLLARRLEKVLFLACKHG